MKINNLLCLMLLISASVITSCKQEKKEVVPQIAHDILVNEIIKADTIKLKNEELVNLYQTSNKATAETIVISSNEEYIDANFILISKYIADNQKKNLIKQDTLISLEDYSITVQKEDFEKRNINGKEYVFFSIVENPMGQFSTATILNFFIIDIAKMYYYNLNFTGYYTLRSSDSETLEGAFTLNKRLNKNPVINQLMLDYAGKSKLIYKPSKEEKNIFYYKNYSEKWERDNHIDGEVANGYSKIPNKIFSTYYKENIIDFTGKISESDVVIENSNYKIVSFFRNNIIAYDIIKKLYFPIFIESCITGCNKEIEFVTKDKIRIVHNEYTGNGYNPEDNPDTSEINLKEIIFKN